MYEAVTVGFEEHSTTATGFNFPRGIHYLQATSRLPFIANRTPLIAFMLSGRLTSSYHLNLKVLQKVLSWLRHDKLLPLLSTLLGDIVGAILIVCTH